MMSREHSSCLELLIFLVGVVVPSLGGYAADAGPLAISGRYPHLAVFNHGDECGIGAVVPWAGKLWAVSYSPHKPQGSDDKLYAIDEQLRIRSLPESIGGTPANRLIHRESNQLIIGPYFIDGQGQVRVVPYSQALGRPTATMRHLTSPAGKVYLFTMEEGLYEIDVQTLAVTTIQLDGHAKGFVDRLPGYHGKGAYTGQGRVVVANNGEKQGPYTLLYDPSGCLAEWAQGRWNVIEEKQFCEVTGPGGIEGNARDDDPVWATGWDKRSAILKVLDAGTWHTFRLPIGDYSYVAKHGWFTEWPRIREVVPAGSGQPSRMLMNLHGLWFDFPANCSARDTSGLRPLGSYLKITGDFCHFLNKIVFACDDTAITGGNRFVNQSQSNFWFTAWEQLGQCGRPAGWGGPWLQDNVKAGQASDPYLLAGFQQRVLHLTHAADTSVTFTLETDLRGDGQWAELQRIGVPAKGYRYQVLDSALPAQWIRLRLDTDAPGVTAYFHYGPGGGAKSDPKLFAGLADIGDRGPEFAGIVRPRGGDLGTLQFLVHRATTPEGKTDKPGYYEMTPDLKLRAVDEASDGRDFLSKTAGLADLDFQMDQASVIVTEDQRRYRLPKGDSAYDHPWSLGWPRGMREVVTERRLLNCHGTFYLLPHKAAGGMAAIKPVCTHGKRISDFCSWRGLLVLAGVRGDAQPDGHTFFSDDRQAGIWCGDVDDLWKLGKPRGVGGPWKETAVQPEETSDPYLMTGFDRKRVALSHNAQRSVTFTLEVDFVRDGSWMPYQAIRVPAGETVEHLFPAGFSAHWVRVKAAESCKATVWFTYD